MRCFIAAWPDDSTRLRLAALAGDLRRRIEHSRAANADDLHLTLAFIGTLADSDAVAVARAATALRFTPFDWQIDTIGFFKQAGVVWAGAGSENQTPMALFELAARMRAILDRMNLNYDARPLAPHVTLFRGVKRFDAELIAPIGWRVSSIALYRSSGLRSGSRYSRVLD